MGAEDEDVEGDEDVRMSGKSVLGLGVGGSDSSDPAGSRTGDKGRLLDQDSRAGTSAQKKKLNNLAHCSLQNNKAETMLFWAQNKRDKDQLKK